jgi:hypothetical protein
MEGSKYDIIDRFLNDELTQEELETFDRQLQEDEDLAEMLAFQLGVRKSLQEEKRRQVRAELDAQLPPVESVRYLFRPYMALAAAVVALLFLIYGLSQFWGEKAPPLLSEAESQQEVQRILERDAVEFQTMGTTGGIALLEAKSAAYLAQSNACEFMDLSYYAGVYSLLVASDYAAAITQLTCAQGFREDVPRLLLIAYCGAGDIQAARDLILTHGMAIDALPPGVSRLLQLSVP